jgi:AraC-like DNA-binding protein
MIPVLLKDIPPGEQLQQYVRKYQVFRFIFDKEVTPPVKFHPPRPEHCITFYLRDVQKFSYLNSTTIQSYPQCVINGIYTTPVYRYGGNDFLAIKVVLQPSTLYQLIKLSVSELTNKFINAEDVWGNEVRSVCERLNELDDLSQMIVVVELFIQNLVKKTRRNSHPFDKVPEYILNFKNDASIEWLASQSCLSIRQFIRKFEQRIGINAKKFERIIRFDKAYRMKNSSSEYDWLYIAVACGYHDYQHMVKDFQEFTNLTPPSLYELDKKSPERKFGLFYKS